MLTYAEIKRYRDLTDQIKGLEKEKDQLNKKFKAEMKREGAKLFASNDLVVKIVPQDRSKLDEESVIPYLKGRGLTSVILTKEVVDQDALQLEIYNGNLAAADLAPFINVNIIETLRVDYVKKDVDIDD